MLMTLKRVQKYCIVFYKGGIMFKLFKAFVIMLRAHIRQKDKAGRCYIFHPINVALGVNGVRAKTVA